MGPLYFVRYQGTLKRVSNTESLLGVEMHRRLISTTTTFSWQLDLRPALPVLTSGRLMRSMPYIMMISVLKLQSK